MRYDPYLRVTSYFSDKSETACVQLCVIISTFRLIFEREVPNKVIHIGRASLRVFLQ